MLALWTPNELNGVGTMHKMNLGLKEFLVAAALTASGAVGAQQVTYDFTGTVTSSGFGSIAAGTTVTGTYTFNLGNADPGLSDNLINESTPWNREVAGGGLFSSLDTSAQTGSVFSSRVTVGTSSTTTFADSGLSAIGNTSDVLGGPQYFSAAVTDYTSASAYTNSSLSLLDSSKAPFGLTGLPVFGVNTSGTGEFELVSKSGSGSYTARQLDYSITSLSPVAAPEISPVSAASSLTLLLGGLAVLRGRRKVAV
jgi:hypothetical protein